MHAWEGDKLIRIFIRVLNKMVDAQKYAFEFILLFSQVAPTIYYAALFPSYFEKMGTLETFALFTQT